MLKSFESVDSFGSFDAYVRANVEQFVSFESWP